jgi:anti-anti-sigma factor
MADLPDVHLDAIDGELVVSVAGEIGFPFGATVQRACEKARRDGVERLVLDLHGVTFLDSDGITALLECRNHADEVGMRFEVRNAPPNVARKLELVGLQSFLSGQ